MWKNVIKVMRSKLFKDTLKNGDYTIKEANKIKTIVITSYNDLMSYIPLYPDANYNSYAIANNEHTITLSNGTVIPPWSSGILVVDADASLTLTCADGSIISASFNNVDNIWKAKKLSGLSSVGSDNKVTAPGLYAVTLNYSGKRVTHMISILDLNTSAYSPPDVSQICAVFVPKTRVIASNNEVAVTVEKVVCIAQYDF